MQNQIVLIKSCAGSLLSKNYYIFYEQLRILLFCISLSGNIRRCCRNGLNQGGLLCPDVFPYLLVLYAMEHKDKQPLETIQYGEDVRHHDGFLV